MYKTGLFALIMVAGLSGCQSAGGIQKLASSDFTQMSCEDIESLFTAYRSDRETAQTMSDLIGAFSPQSGTAANQTITDSDQLYQQAVTAANSALELKGCTQKRVY